MTKDDLVYQEMSVLCTLRRMGDLPRGSVVSFDEAEKLIGGGAHRVLARLGRSFGFRDFVLPLTSRQVEAPLSPSRGRRPRLHLMTPEEQEAIAEREAAAEAQRKAEAETRRQERLAEAKAAETTAAQALKAARKARRLAESEAVDG